MFSELRVEVRMRHGAKFKVRRIPLSILGCSLLRLFIFHCENIIISILGMQDILDINNIYVLNRDHDIPTINVDFSPLHFLSFTF